jgi:hypothetical protein
MLTFETTAKLTDNDIRDAIQDYLSARGYLTTHKQIIFGYDDQGNKTVSVSCSAVITKKEI